MRTTMYIHAFLLSFVVVAVATEGHALSSLGQSLPGLAAPNGSHAAVSPTNCFPSIRDHANTSNCIDASTIPTLGMLYPLSGAFFVSDQGDIGIGTTTPDRRLTVAGPIHSLAGGIEFPDGTVQTTAQVQGPQGPQGEPGSQGPPGNPGPPGSQGQPGPNQLSSSTAILNPINWSAFKLTVADGWMNFTSNNANKWVIDVTGQTNASGGVSAVANKSSGAGVLGIGNNGASGVAGNAFGNSPSNAAIYGLNSNSAGYAGYFSGNLHATGNFTASGTKNFVSPHPTDPTKEIVFACLEGNENGTYCRGSTRLVHGVATIQLPEEFGMVTASEGITVQLTPSGNCNGLYVARKTVTSVEVRELNGGRSNVDFDYIVQGVRSGFEHHQSVQPNQHFVPKTAGRSFGEQFPESVRSLLRANGTLCVDDTVNAMTAQDCGWHLESQGASRQTRPR